MRKFTISVGVEKHLLFQIVHFYKNSAEDSGQGSLGLVVSGPSADMDWVGTQPLWTAGPACYRASIYL